MAELIPISYRLRAAQRRHARQWAFGGALVLAVALGGLALMFGWERRQASEYHLALAEYQKKSSAIGDSQRVIAAREGLAKRMQTVQQLMDDRMLLTVLQGVCEGFSSSDSLEYINVDARAPGKDEARDGPFVVRITGITANNATLADLITRLGRPSSGGMAVVLESSHRDTLYDGQVVRFELRCQPAGTKGS